MSLIERAREHPARFLLPNGMTVARPILGWQALLAVREGNWARAQRKTILAWLTDAEGSVARPLDATSQLGATLDPIADGIWRLEMALALAPHFNKFFGALSVALEINNIAINKEVQENLFDPDIPKGAKNGMVVQGIGIALFTQGMKKDSKVLKKTGEAVVTAGAVMRNTAYRLLRMEKRRSDE